MDFMKKFNTLLLVNTVMAAKVLFIVVLVTSSVSAAENECAFCRKDHKDVCNFECEDSKGAPGVKKCHAECLTRKCMTPCKDIDQSTECKSCEAKFGSICDGRCTSEPDAKKESCKKECVKRSCVRNCSAEPPPPSRVIVDPRRAK